MVMMQLDLGIENGRERLIRTSTLYLVAYDYAKYAEVCVLFQQLQYPNRTV